MTDTRTKCNMNSLYIVGINKDNLLFLCTSLQSTKQILSLLHILALHINSLNIVCMSILEKNTSETFKIMHNTTYALITN